MEDGERTVTAGRHALPKETTATNKIIATGSLALGGLGLSLVAAPSAGAATVADWGKVASCESGGRWNLPYGDADSTGGIQFQSASWQTALAYLRTKGVDTSGYPAAPYLASKQQQIMAGEALLATQGPEAWTCNAKMGSPLDWTGPHSSMFKGGLNPYPAAPSAPSTPPAAPTVAPSVPDKTPEPSPVASEAGRTTGVKPSGHDHYTVRSGDTLYGIEKTRSGDGSLDNWRKLYDMNRTRISDPDLIYPGQVLNVPLKGAAPVATKPAPATVAAPDFVLPVKAPITNPYGAPGPYASGHHTGVDFGAAQGTQVKAAAAGTVVASDTSSAYGTNVQIKHADGRYTMYAHLSLKAVTPGMKVNAGDLIGRVGNTGTNSSGPHLHFEVRTTPQHAGHVDPLAWLRSHGVTI